MVVPNNILSFGQPHGADAAVSVREEGRGGITACRQLFLRQLPTLMESMFQRLDDCLYTMADKSGSDHRQALYFDAMRVLRLKRNTMESQFNEEILRSYDNLWKQGPGVSLLRIDSSQKENSFELIDNSDLEETLAISSMISKGENSYFRALYTLDRRFSHILNGLEVAGSNNPLAPTNICNAFSNALGVLALELQVKLVVYKQFERDVVANLGGFYADLNEALASAGVLPQISHSVHRTPGSSVHSQTRAQSPQGQLPRMSAGDSSIALPGELFDTLQQLLERQRGAAGVPGKSSTGQLQAVQSMDVLSALSALQQAGPVAEDVKDGLFHVLNIDSEGRSGKQINRSDEDALDVISMLFEFILEDPGLADAMRVLLARLQIPMLKVAILDKSFFSKKDHPARRLLNTLAQSAVGWSDIAGKERGGLYRQIESIVERILIEFSDNIDLFEILNEEYRAFLATHQQGAEIAERRASQVTQGKEQLHQAKREVREQIATSLDGKTEVPEVALTLIEEGWAGVLQLISLREGVDSDRWNSAVTLMDQLLWSVEPKLEKDEQQRLLSTIPALLKGLRNGLGDISFDQHKMTRLFKELQQCHVGCLRGSSKKVKMVTPRCDLPEAEPEVPLLEEIVIPVSPVAEKPDGREGEGGGSVSLSIGDWLELESPGKGSLRMKLSWRSQVTGRCLFVNHRGVKVEEVSGEEVSDWLSSGKARLVVDRCAPLMDRALEAMLKVLDKGEVAPDPA